MEERHYLARYRLLFAKRLPPDDPAKTCGDIAPEFTRTETQRPVSGAIPSRDPRKGKGCLETIRKVQIFWKIEWWWTQSEANRSHSEFPCFTGNEQGKTSILDRISAI